MIPVTRRRRTRVIARRKRAVRGEHQGRALRGQHPMGEKKVFFGDFLSPDKKLPAGRRTAEAGAPRELPADPKEQWKLSLPKRNRGAPSYGRLHIVRR